MQKLSKILRHLPVVIYFGYVLLLLTVFFNLTWYLEYNNAIELVDFVLCVIMILHALFNFNTYSVFAKSSLLTIIALAVYHSIYYTIEIQNFDYYAIYIIILLSNFAYIVFREFTKPK